MIVGPIMLTLFLRLLWHYYVRPRTAFDHSDGYPGHIVVVDSPLKWECLTCHRTQEGKHRVADSAVPAVQ